MVRQAAQRQTRLRHALPAATDIALTNRPTGAQGLYTSGMQTNWPVKQISLTCDNDCIHFIFWPMPDHCILQATGRMVTSTLCAQAGTTNAAMTRAFGG